MLKFDDTICAPATTVGSGAISVIRVSGPDALAIVDKVVCFRKGSAGGSAGYSLKFGSIPDTDDVLVSIFRAPHSYTGEDGAEISCHASTFVVTRILEKLIQAGARMAEPGEFTRRAFVNGKMDLAQAEAVADVIAASTEAAHRVAINQLRGHYSEELRGIRDELLELTALMELELDFSEEDVEFADRAKLRALLESASEHIERLAGSFRAGNAVKNGVPVAIVGAPNSGKSTLLNALLGEDRAIVSDIPGTTRDSIEDTMVLDGILFRFIDTAGIRESDDVVERMGIERSLDKLAKADVVIEVIDATAPVELDLADGCGEGLAAHGSADGCGEGLTAHGSADGCGEGPAAHGSADGCGEGPASCPGVSVVDGCGEGLANCPCVSVVDGRTLVRVSNKTDVSPALDGTLAISAKSGIGLDELRRVIVDSQKDRFVKWSGGGMMAGGGKWSRGGMMAGGGMMDGQGMTLVTNLRHYEALCRGLDALGRVRDGMGAGLTSDLLAEDLRDSVGCLNEIFGDAQQIDFKAVTDLIFGRFCIGK